MPPGRHGLFPRFVTLSSATRGATIRYTTDNTAPTGTNGYAYTAPFLVKADGTLWAWGNNTANQLGRVTVYHDSPVQVVCSFGGAPFLVSGSGASSSARLASLSGTAAAESTGGSGCSAAGAAVPGLDLLLMLLVPAGVLAGRRLGKRRSRREGDRSPSDPRRG